MNTNVSINFLQGEKKTQKWSIRSVGKKWLSMSEFYPKTKSNEITNKNPNPSSDNFFGKDVKRDIKAKWFVPPKDEEPVKVWSLLWLEQVWQCIFIEYKDDIIMIDAGMQFSSGDSIMWADYAIPDISYIKKNIKKFRGIVLTHWHLDHIWALRHILPDLNFPMLYTTPLTLGLVKKTFDNAREMSKIKYKIVEPENEILELWCFKIEFARVNHNIPETFALSIRTPKWVIFTSADFKIDFTPAIGKPAELARIAKIGTEWVKFYIWDSLNCRVPGYVKSEKMIWNILEDIIRTTNWRLIISTFATNVGRSIQIIRNAIKWNKIVFLSGRSMVNNIEVCQELGYINVPKANVRKLDKSAEDMPDDKVVILCTGAQWEELSALARMARDEHTQIKLREWDTILISGSTIPWNELSMQVMKNNLITKKVNLITNADMDVHTSWHGGAEDHKMMLHLLNPDYFMPFYMDAFPRYAYRKLALDMWMEDEKILMPETNWAIIEIYDKWVQIAKKWLKLDTILIDGKWMWQLAGEYIIRARKIMAENWMIWFILKIDTKSKELIWNIQIESRWFVYSTEVQKVHTDIVNFVRKKYNDNCQKMKTKDVLKKIKEELGVYIEHLIWREPMIIPMFVYINRETSKEEIEWDLIIDVE